MAGGFRQWASSIDREAMRQAVNDAADRGATGLFEARDDIRHKLVEEGWFGHQTTGDVALPGSDYTEAPNTADLGPDPANPAQIEAEGFGGTVWENESNQDYTPDTPEIEAPQHEPDDDLEP